MHWAYYVTIGLLVAYFGGLLIKRLIDKKRGIEPRGCTDCAGRGKALVASYHAMKKKEEKSSKAR